MRKLVRLPQLRCKLCLKRLELLDVKCELLAFCRAVPLWQAGKMGTSMPLIRSAGKKSYEFPEIRCFAESPVLTSQFGDDREVVVAYYLTEAWAEFNSFTDGLPHRSYMLPNSFDTEIQP